MEIREAFNKARIIKMKKQHIEKQTQLMFLSLQILLWVHISRPKSKLQSGDMYPYLLGLRPLK